MALMRPARVPRVAALCLAALALACLPVAVAIPKPAIYFLGDSPQGVVNDGLLLAPSPGLVPNTTSPQLRPILPVVNGPLPGVGTLHPVRFVTPLGMEHPERIKGFLYVGLWTGASPMLHGNLSAQVSELKADGKVVPLGNASVAIDANTSKLPAPTALVPPNPTPDPADPQGWVTSVAFYEAVQALPVVLQPPTLMKLGLIDVQVNATSQIAVDFSLLPEPGGAAQGAPAAPLPVGAGATVQYNYTLDPSFAYIPWYAPDPVPTKGPTPPPPVTRPVTPSSPHPTGQPATSPAPTSSAHKSPSLGIASAVALVGAALMLRRRTA